MQRGEIIGETVNVFFTYLKTIATIFASIFSLKGGDCDEHTHPPIPKICSPKNDGTVPRCRTGFSPQFT